MSAALHRHTPELRATDPRGREVRQVGYQRSQAGQDAETRVTLSRHNPNGCQVRQWDPRLSARLVEGDSVTPAQARLRSLSGVFLLDEHIDSGWRLALHGEAGQPVQRWDGRGTHWASEYDPLLRPLAVHETADGQPPRVAERCVWGAAWDHEGNRCGRLVRHDDDAGCRLLHAYDLTGKVQEETRHFLSLLDLPDWPAATAERDALLEPGNGARTRYRHGPPGELLELTDAVGNRQASRFNLAGQQAAQDLWLADSSCLPLLMECRYNALGQIQQQIAGNGVLSHCDYDPATGRLRRQRASRPQRGQLQDLHYDHDPVGNLLRIEDLSQPTRHFANQKVDPVSTFAYDSLYRLTEATGREAAGAMIGPGLPDLVPSPGDTSRLLNYREHFTYDAAGNLLELRHVGQHNYSRPMAVAQDSNHALPWQDDTAPEDPRAGFDANGNLLRLAEGQPLHWHPRNWLHATRQVSRDGDGDEEQYRYGADGLRLRKVTSRLVAGRVQRTEVRYLPGLELRGEWAVSTAQAGRCAVRCLVGQDSAAAQLRYTLSDLHDSCALELDGDGRIISHEGYYPFGGTAWWAARSAGEASHKTHRYCGKERDASGLYDYGLRYYAPWLARWVSPDPAGDVDGLNRFVMVSNNPLTLRDERGLMESGRKATPPLQLIFAASEQMEGFEETVETLEPIASEWTEDLDGIPPRLREPDQTATETTADAKEKKAARMAIVASISHSDPLEGTIQSEDQTNFVTYFLNNFTADRWTLKHNYRNPRAGFYGADVIEHQYRLVSHKDGFENILPSLIVRENVLNEDTLHKLEGIENGSMKMMAVFLKTVIGRSTQRIANEFGLWLTHVQRHGKNINVRVLPEKPASNVAPIKAPRRNSLDMPSKVRPRPCASRRHSL